MSPLKSNLTTILWYETAHLFQAVNFKLFFNAKNNLLSINHLFWTLCLKQVVHFPRLK